MSIPKKINVQTLPNFLSMLAVAQSFTGSIAIHYIFPVLWMTSCLPIIPGKTMCIGFILKVAHQGSNLGCLFYDCIVQWVVC